MAKLTLTEETKSVTEQSFELKEGVYYFTEFLNSTGKLLSVTRYEVNEPDGIISYLRLTPNSIDMVKPNKYNRSQYSRLLLVKLNLKEDTFISNMKYRSEIIDSDTFVKYYNKFYSELVPFFL